MRAGSLLGSLALAVLLQDGAVRAEDCGPLKQVNAVDLVAGPNRAMVPVSINGIPKLFLLDTGGDVTQISGDVAEELKLTQQDSNLKLLDMYGHASSKMVRIDKFNLGRLHGEDIHMAIQPNPDFGKGTRYVGLFGPDMMGRYDVDIDFGTYKMNYFSPEHCPGHVVYWSHAALGVAPMSFRDRHIRLPVQIDGKELRAEIDTGATNTVMMAAAFGRVFSTLDFEGVAVHNAHVVIVPDLLGSKDPNNGYRTDSHIKKVDDDVDRADLLIGMDILKKLHLYIAFDEKKLYISEASTPPTQTGLSAPADLRSGPASTVPAQ
jgi:predicted aspartyl protease